MAAHSPSKTGVNALFSRPSTSCARQQRRGWPAFAGHDDSIRPEIGLAGAARPQHTEFASRPVDRKCLDESVTVLALGDEHGFSVRAAKGEIGGPLFQQGDLWQRSAVWSGYRDRAAI